MERRLQTVNDDTVLEITESAPQKRRLSEKTLRRNKAYLEQSVARFQARLKVVDVDLAEITAAKDAEAKR